jgi:hypothetical protein
MSLGSEIREMSDSEKYKPPAPGAGDKAYAVVRAAVGSIPLVGNAATELLSALFAPPLERRRQRWMEEIADALRILEENRQISLSDLQSNESFITTLVQASEAAVRNHQKEKVEALRNAVVNSALGINIKEDLQLAFIRYVNELSPSHLSLLTFFRDNEQKFERVQSYQELFQSFVSENPNADIQREEFYLLCSDLTARVLLQISANVEDFNDIGLNDYIVTERYSDKPLLRVTDIGRKLLQFLAANDQGSAEPGSKSQAVATE